jgi:hypothetical protein
LFKLDRQIPEFNDGIGSWWMGFGHSERSTPHPSLFVAENALQIGDLYEQLRDFGLLSSYSRALFLGFLSCRRCVF